MILRSMGNAGSPLVKNGSASQTFSQAGIARPGASFATPSSAGALTRYCARSLASAGFLAPLKTTKPWDWPSSRDLSVAGPMQSEKTWVLS